MASNTHSLDLESSSSQYAERNDTASLSVTSDFTLECYVNFESLPTSGNTMTLISKWSTVSNQRSYTFGLFNDTGTYKLQAGVSNDGTGESFSTVSWTPSLSTWYHVAVVYTQTSSANFVYYVNGGQQGGNQDTADWAVFDSTARFVVGALEGSSYANFFDGLIDEVRIWNVARSALQIATYRQIDVSGESGIVGYWKLNNNYNDSTANGNDISAVATPVFSTTVPFSDYNVITTDQGYAYFM